MKHGVVWLDHILDTANVNTAAADLLDLPAGEVLASDFIAAMMRLAGRALNRSEIPVLGTPLFDDPTEDIDFTFCFSQAPTRLHVSSYTARQDGFACSVWAFEDVSALPDALAASEAAQALLRASADSMLDPQVLLEAVRNADGRVVDFLYRSANRATCSYLGLSEGEIIGRSALELLPNLESSGLLARHIQCLDDGQPVILNDFLYSNRDLGGARRYDVRTTLAGADLLSLTWRDVTERFQDMQRIAVSEQNYRMLSENADDVVSHIRDEKFVWISPSVEGLLGAPADYWLGRSVREVLPPEEESAHAARQQWLREGGTVDQPVQLMSLDGVRHWVRLHAKPFYDADGRLDGSTVALRVIDENVAAQETAEEARRQQAWADERFRRSINNASVGMCLVTPDGQLHEVNDAMGRLFGLDAQKMNGMYWQDFTAQEYLDEELDDFNGILEGRIDSYRMTKQYNHADGHHIWGDLSVSCLRRPNGEVEQFIAQITDITALVEANERNRILAQQLQWQTDRLTAELESAASYMSSIMPQGLKGEVSVSSRYLPSRELGGDSFDYTWIDDDHLLVYLIDVSGHGLEPALLTVSLHNMLRSGSLAPETLLVPDEVLGELNQRFQMDQQGYHYFTMWCGIYEASSRTLTYASAGAPPALAFTTTDGGAVAVAELSTGSAPVGMFEDTEFASRTYHLPPGSRVLVYSDGASELTLAGDRQLSLADFKNLCTRLAGSPDWSLDRLIDELRALTSSPIFEDDLSLIQLTFD